MAETAWHSRTPLVKKLGFTPSMQIGIVNEPATYRALLGSDGQSLHFRNQLDDGMEAIHLFVKQQAELADLLPKAKGVVAKNGRIWISWPKKSSGIPSDLDENLIREMAIDAGLVDIKVCSIDSVWSGLMLVYRVKDR